MAQRIDVRYVRYYTDGSAARKLAPVQPFKTMKLPRVTPRKHRVIRIDPVATAGILMAAVMLVLLVVGAVELMHTRQEAARMERYVMQLEADSRDLTVTYRSKYKLEDVQKTADALGLIPREEARHITIRVPAEPEMPVKTNLMDRFYSFLTGLFA